MRLPVAVVLAQLACLAFLTPALEAQVVFVHFKSDKAAKRHADHITSFRGEPALIGEIKEGVTLKDGKMTFTSGGDAKNVFWVCDPAKPQNIPYEIKDGKKVTAKGGAAVAVPGDSIARLGFVDQYLTLEGVAIEFAKRTDELKTLRDLRDESKKGDRDWFANHGRLIQKIESLGSWLTQMGFGAAAKKWKSDLDREKKVVAKEASALREKAALGSIHAVETSEHLATVATAILGPKAKFNVRESQHGRMIYPVDMLTDAEAEHGLELLEQLVEGFRKQFVDPYLDEDFPDYIPDHVFAEFFFAPEEITAYERFLVEYYGQPWGENKERLLGMSGFPIRAGKKGYIEYKKKYADLDLEGAVAHSMGHMLADLQYNAGYQQGLPDWLQEGVAYYMSFEYLGRNSITCFDWGKSTYAKQAAPDGVKTVQLGQKGTFNEVALAHGATFDALFIKPLFQFDDADLAKSWSYFDFIAKTLGKNGQVMLRTLTIAQMRGKTGFLERERPGIEKMFEVEPGKDVYAVLEERWRTFAKNKQLK